MVDDVPSGPLLNRLRIAIGAWQPLTGRGLAAFADASGARILAFQVVLASLMALAVVWSARQIVTTTVEYALPNLPEEPAGIAQRKLRWPDREVRLLAQSPHLALAVDPEATGELGLNGDLQIELGHEALIVRGVLGQSTVGYGSELDLPLDRTSAVAAWGAWRVPLLAVLGVASVLFFLATWWVLATLYFLPTWLFGWILRRQLTASGAWRLCSASLWPAALIPGTALLLYTTLWIRLPGLIALWAIHFPAAWFWLIWSVISLPARTSGNEVPRPNPFANASTDRKRSRSTAEGRARNPFAD